MTHNREHVIIHKLTNTVSMNPGSTTSKVKVWHCVLALLLVGFIAGALVF